MEMSQTTPKLEKVINFGGINFSNLYYTVAKNTVYRLIRLFLLPGKFKVKH